MEYKRGSNLSDYYDSVALTPNETIFVSPNKRAHMQQDIEDATRPWGALAVLKEVEAQCSYMPASALSVGRTAFVIAPAITMAFIVNDVLNNNRAEKMSWPCVLLLCLVFALEVCTIAYNSYYDNRILNHQEFSPHDKGAKVNMEEGENRFTFELREILNAHEFEMGIRASDIERICDIERDTTLLDQGVKSSSEVHSDNNEEGKEEATSPVHADCLAGNDEEMDEEAASPMHVESLDSELWDSMHEE